MLIHAAGESSPGNLPSSTYAVALTCPDEAALRAIAERLKACGVRCRTIHEPDAPWDGALMAVGIEPGPKKEVGRHLANLPLLK